MIEQNITSALILEDDADWDIRIKHQMRDFAKASRLLIQPDKSDRFLDPTYPQPNGNQTPQNFDIKKDITGNPSTSPYGDIDHWDLLWIGHCGSRFPSESSGKIPLARAAIYDDETVPEPQHINMQFGDSELASTYPAHTRVVSRAWKNVCTVGYAISLPGARRILYEMSVNKMTAETDMMLQAVCEGTEERPVHRCLSVQPQLFQHHRPVGHTSSFSDISDHGADYNEKAFTRNVRWSTRINFRKLVDGLTDYVDLFKDGEEADPNLGFG